MSKVKKKRKTLRWILLVSLWTFLLAVILGLVTQYLVSTLYSLYLSFIILLVVIFIGIFFDTIGTAAAAANIGPLNAKATRKVPGARQGVYLVQNAEQFANFTNDMVGDISGIISGALSAVIVIRLAVSLPLPRTELYAGIVLAALVASLTVGGKAWGKVIAINHPTEVILFVGRVWYFFRKPLEWLASEKR